MSKSDGSQTLDLQRDALQAAGVEAQYAYEDHASSSQEDRPGLEAMLKVLLHRWKRPAGAVQVSAAEALTVQGQVDGSDMLQPKALGATPVQEQAGRAQVGGPRVLVADGHRDRTTLEDREDLCSSAT